MVEGQYKVKYSCLAFRAPYRLVYFMVYLFYIGQMRSKYCESGVHDEIILRWTWTGKIMIVVKWDWNALFEETDNEKTGIQL